MGWTGRRPSKKRDAAAKKAMDLQDIEEVRQPGGVGHSVVPGEDTQHLDVRVGQTHLDRLDDLIRWGYARDRSSATRKAILEAHLRNSKKVQ